MSVDTLRAVANLQKHLGDELFEALIDANNIHMVYNCAKKLAFPLPLPAIMTVGNRVYDILGLFKEGEVQICSDMMVPRAKELNVCYEDHDDLDHLLKHQDDIPTVLRGRVDFIFPFIGSWFGFVYWSFDHDCWDKCFVPPRDINEKNQKLLRRRI